MTPKSVFPNPVEMVVNQTEGSTDKPLIDMSNSNEVDMENGWTVVGSVDNKRKRGMKGTSVSQNNTDTESSSLDSSPTNATKTVKLQTNIIGTKLSKSFEDWKHEKIGSGHLKSEKLFQFLKEGLENISAITAATQKYSSNASLLRKQLEVLIGKISDDDVKRYIKEVCEVIPLRVPPNP